MLNLAVALLIALSVPPPDRPNILWITAEDMSAVLGCYGDEAAITPNIDKLATESVRYTHAFASAPVCSPSRSCLITGCYAPSLGTQQMRSAFPIPEKMTGFPSLIKKQGYYTTNNVKTDYNTANWQKIIAASWDESSAEAHWRKSDDAKQGKKPFFSIFNLMTSHQSRAMVWPYDKFKAEVQSKLSPEQIHDPATIPLPPYYPDTPVVRKTQARFYECVTAMDKQVGELLAQLEEDGLAKNTIVFFYSDHGSGLPRHKRALLDSGMHVPLLIRFPEKYKHLAPKQAGETTDQLVSFVDFGPTVLSLLGIQVPEFMQGIPFLGKQKGEPREMIFGHRDRVDEVRDLARSVRTKKYLYIRNYMPHLSYNQPTAWPDLGEIRHEFYQQTANPEQNSESLWHFIGPNRPAEELYDCEADPMNLKNLADSPDHAEIRDELYQAHHKHLHASKDLGFFPESEAWKLSAGTTPWEASQAGKMDGAQAISAAEKIGFGREADFLELLNHEDPSVRYWAAMGLAGLDELSAPAQAKLYGALDDESLSVQIEAANALLRTDDATKERALPVLTGILESDDLSAVLHAARTIEMLGEMAKDAVPSMEKLIERGNAIRPADMPATVVQSGDQDLAMFFSFSAEAFLKAMK